MQINNKIKEIVLPSKFATKRGIEKVPPKRNNVKPQYYKIRDET